MRRTHIRVAGHDQSMQDACSTHAGNPNLCKCNSFESTVRRLLRAGVRTCASSVLCCSLTKCERYIPSTVYTVLVAAVCTVQGKLVYVDRETFLRACAPLGTVENEVTFGAGPYVLHAAQMPIWLHLHVYSPSTNGAVWSPRVRSVAGRPACVVPAATRPAASRLAALQRPAAHARPVRRRQARVRYEYDDPSVHRCVVL
jgi:hypothetical protein